MNPTLEALMRKKAGEPVELTVNPMVTGGMMDAGRSGQSQADIDEELAFMRRTGALPPTGERQGGIAQGVRAIRDSGDYGQGLLGAGYDAVTSDPMGVAKQFIYDPAVKSAQWINDAARGQVPITDPQGRTSMDTIENITDLAGLGTGAGGVKSALRGQMPNTVGMSGGGAKSTGLLGAGSSPIARRASDEVGAAAIPTKMGQVIGRNADGKVPKSVATVTRPEAVRYPGIYDRPDVIAERAAAMVAPETPYMKQLFDVNRDELYEMGQGRVGNTSIMLPKNARQGINANASRVTGPKNTQRLLDTLSEAEKHPSLQKGMDSWYVMDPLYQQFERLYGPDRAFDEFNRFNSMTGMASPGADVLTEINRGTAANWLDKQGRFDDFVKYGGKEGRGPADMKGIKGHAYHSTAHSGPMGNYLERGDMGDMGTTKVPLYARSYTNPVSYQSDLPVGDAHYVRGIGLSDVRTSKGFGESIKNTELSTIAPWWKEKISDELGITPVQAQGRSWGTFAPATGVETQIGAPKLELLSQRIMEAAKRYGVTPEQARDMVLSGKGFASITGAGLLGAGAMQNNGQDRQY